MSEDLVLDPVLRVVLRGALALLLLWAAGHKLRDLARFEAALTGYGLLPHRLVPAAARTFAAVELALATGLLTPGMGSAPALAAAALLSLYSAAIAVNLLRGRRDIDCGCTGPAQRRLLGPGLLLRNALLGAAALSSALPGAPRSLVWLDGFTIVVGVAAASLLYGAAEAAQATAPRLAELRGDR